MELGVGVRYFGFSIVYPDTRQKLVWMGFDFSCSVQFFSMYAIYWFYFISDEEGLSLAYCFCHGPIAQKKSKLHGKEFLISEVMA